MRVRVLVVLVLTVVLFAVPATAQAQPPPGAAQEGFVPVDQLPKPEDTLPAPRLLATAYGFVWVVLFLYIWSIWRRLATVERELEAVSRRVSGETRR
jgi:CcmD family protein